MTFAKLKAILKKAAACTPSKTSGAPSLKPCRASPHRNAAIISPMQDTIPYDRNLL
jgi:hypothetical protein